MALSQNAQTVISRKIPAGKIKKRPGKGGLEFDYVSADFVIDTLNEAFGGSWSTKVVNSERVDNVVIVCVELEVADEEGRPIKKQQYGSCEITRGLGVGEAYKGAASDALKKAATLLGVALELYHDEPTPVDAPPFVPPQAPNRSAPPARPISPPRPPLSQPVAVPRPPKVNVVPAAPAPVAPPKAVSVAATPQKNPWGSTAEGPNPTQINALTNIAARKNMSQQELIGSANIKDSQGNPVSRFEDLTYDQAIQVIRAAQS